MMNSPDSRPISPPVTGLTESQVAERRSRGLGNQVVFRSSRSYRQILAENLFTFINIVLFGLGFALIALGRPSDALISVGVILVNVIVNVVQEIRAKRVLDRIALITRPTATVLRGGAPQKIDPAEIVIGDILSVEPGDQIVVDGAVIRSAQATVDESLLSGESDPIEKHDGTEVFSGSFCVSGSLLYEAQKVGADSLSARITASAKAFRRVRTPIQQEINLVVRVLLLVAGYFEILQLVNAAMEHRALVEVVQFSVVVLGLVPNGLFLAIAAAYTLGAVRIAGKGALVQQANAIESLSNVNLICLDKTGTLTTNRIQFNAVHAVQGSETDLRQRLGAFCATTTTHNPTITAIAATCSGQAQPIIEEVPFSSEYKWSALAMECAGARGVYVLGAPEVLLPALSTQVDLKDLTQAWFDQGLRVVGFAFTSEITPLRAADGRPTLPQGLSLLGLVSLADEVRPGMRQTLDLFRKSGVQLKIISGDNPDTVAALARQAGFDSQARPVSGLDLAQMDAAQFEQTLNNASIFGRITPQQKELMVRLLRSRGQYVAMIGDGVNDVLSLKQANLAIALQSGSQATRSVADLILLNDAFSVLPEVLREGQRILTGMQDILKIFLSRILYVALLILATGFVGSFPLTPKNSSLLSLFTVGIPSIALSIWAKPEFVPSGRLIRRIARFILPAGLLLSLAGLFVFIAYLYAPTIMAGSFALSDTEIRGPQLAIAQTALTSFSIFCGLLLLVFVEPPNRFWVAGDHLSGDPRMSYLAGILFVIYLAINAVPMLRNFFELAPLKLLDLLLLCALTALWGFLLRWIWRSRVLDRFLSMDFDTH